MASLRDLIAVSICAFAASVSAQSCPAQLKSPKPAQLRCGGHFMPTVTRSALSTSTGSLSDCADRCIALGTSACMALTYNANSQLCTPYRRNGQVTGLTKSTDGTQFYNVGCFTQPAYTPLVPDDSFNLLIHASYDPNGDLNNSTVVRSALNPDSERGGLIASAGNHTDGPYTFTMIQVGDRTGLYNNVLSLKACDGEYEYITKEPGLETSDSSPAGSVYATTIFQLSNYLQCQADPCTAAFTCDTEYESGPLSFYGCPDSIYLSNGGSNVDGCIPIDLSVTNIQYDSSTRAGC